MPVPVEFYLDDEPDAVARARQVAASALAGEPAETVADLLLVVTELLTNAVLHGAPPVTLRINRIESGEGERLRVEVHDAGRTTPVRSGRITDAMTGRGLALVAAMCARWGVDSDGTGGKTVWAEVAGLGGAHGGEMAGSSPWTEPALVVTGSGADGRDPRYRVRLGAVPTDLLLAAKAHIDNVVREFTLMRKGRAASGIALPADLSELVVAVTEDFAEARVEIKRQALAAAHRGESVTDLVLNLPVTAADAGERYLAALDDVDQFARAARLLTLAPPRSHRAFRQWYVQSLVEQLRAAADGKAPSEPTPFPQVLAGEVDRLSALEESWEQLRCLQEISSDLARAHSAQEIADSVVDNARKYRGVETSRVYLLTDDGTLRAIASRGLNPGVADLYAEFSLDADLPAAKVARSGQPLFMRSLTQLHRALPEFEGSAPQERSLHIAPLRVSGHMLGVLAITFVAGEIADEAQLAFVRAIADMLAQALERAAAIERVESERGRELQLLAAQFNVLTNIVAGQSLAEALASLLKAIESASTEGMLSSVLVLDADGQHLRHCAAPSLPDFYNDAIDGIEIGPAAGSCGTAAYLHAQVIVENVQTDPRWAAFRDLAAAANLQASWSTPIAGQDGRLLGTFAMYYPQPKRPSAADLALTDVLVRTVALVIERSRVDEMREQERAAALTLQHSLLPSVPPSIGPLTLAARYRAGDPGVEVGGDWFDAVAVAGGVVLIVGDVQGHDLRAAALMGQLRTVGRAYASEGHSPAAVLAHIHHYLQRIDTELLATAVVVRVDTTTNVATVASAGHLPPLMLQRAEDAWLSIDLVDEVGPPLGVGDKWIEHTSVMPPRATLLLYTDGLVESRAWPIDYGLMLLHKTLQSLPADAAAAEVLDAALELLPAGSRGDDVALLAATMNP